MSKVSKIAEVLKDFIEFDCIPAERIFHEQLGSGDRRWEKVPAILEQLKSKAQLLGLWNLWIPSSYPESPGLTNLEYAYLCEIMGRSFLGAEVDLLLS
ncbi:hypothetical protein HK098_003992 [Nowakowskiella sp. JEL0407]|nr:hypothetical protein HK098_003992 [Nowakowskiella sp. JEL0407]